MALGAVELASPHVRFHQPNDALDTLFPADDEAADRAVEMGDFDTLQLTYNVLQQEPGRVVEAARKKDMGIIVKNPIANAVYEHPRPEDDAASLWDCSQQLLGPETIGDLPRVETCLRWLLSQSDVHTAIVGTKSTLAVIVVTPFFIHLGASAASSIISIS